MLHKVLRVLRGAERQGIRSRPFPIHPTASHMSAKNNEKKTMQLQQRRAAAGRRQLEHLVILRLADHDTVERPDDTVHR